jgi:hypothetical protein
MIFDKQSARKAATCGFAFALLVGVAAGCGGDASAMGPTGSVLSNLEIVSVQGNVPASTTQGYGQLTLTATCPAGKKVIGGGFAVTGDLPGGAYAYQSLPSASGSWTAAINNTFVNPQTATVYATCALAS